MLVSLAVTACGGAPAPSPAHAAPAPAVAVDALPDRGWGMVESSRFSVALPLPDAAGWRVDDASGRWLVATHLASKSMLWVRAWRAGSVVGHAACETEARPWRPDVLGRDASALVDRRPLAAPPGFDAEVGFAVHRARDALGGVAVGVFAKVRQCLVIGYVTRADGADAPGVVARRLALVTERVLSRVETRDVEDRVVPVAR